MLELILSNRQSRVITETCILLHAGKIPKLDLAMATVEFYYDYIVHQEASANDLTGLPTDLTAYREQYSKEAVLFLDLCKL